jgi:hypothetical protein
LLSIHTNGYRFQWNAGVSWCVTERYSGTPSRWFLPIYELKPARASEPSLVLRVRFPANQGISRSETLGHSGPRRSVGLEAADRSPGCTRPLSEGPDRAARNFELRSRGKLSIVCFRHAGRPAFYTTAPWSGTSIRCSKQSKPRPCKS